MRDARLITKSSVMENSMSLTVNDTTILSDWKYNPCLIRDFLLDYANIDCDPIWQRPDISSNQNSDSSKASKQQSIMQSIIDGFDIGEIKLCLYKGRKSSIDGGNRKRAIYSFLNNKFKLHKSSNYPNMYYRDLPKEVQDTILNYKLRFIQYKELTDDIIGKMFRSTNNTTHVNHQEMLNSYGMNLIARLVRETVRKFEEIGNTPHPLFKYGFNKTGKVVFEYFSFNNNRLFLEEVVARILCLVVNGEKFGVASDEMLERMYIEKGDLCDKDPKLLEKYKKKLDEALNFILEVCKVGTIYRNKGLAKCQVSMLLRLYFHFKQEYGDFRVPNYDAFWNEFSNAMNKFDSKNPVRKESFKERGASGKGKTRVVSEAFNGYLTFELDDEWKLNQSLKWMLQEFDPLNVIVPVDPKRCFPRDHIENALIKQKYLCYVDGKPLNMKDAVGAHKKAWSRGGKTVRRNLVAVRSIHNKNSGAMDIDTYKKAIGF